MQGSKKIWYQLTFIPLEQLVELNSCLPSTSNSAEDMWLAGWILKKKDGTFLHSNWNGWMKSIHNSVSKEISHIEYQPIIDGNPNDYSTIYTSLLRCIESEKPKVSVITFDLPIWLKSVDIILSHKLPVIPRLGGVHLLKSFLGTFGHIFSDSGLHEIIELIYPGQVVAESILNGNSYDKAIRAHLSIDAAIVQHKLPPNEFTDAELSAIECLINHALENQNGIDSNEFPIVDIIQSKIKSVFDKLGLAGRTPALWVLYHNMVQTIKIFIRAERMADFSLHLSCITNRMLHIFAAAGHHKCAKCARLYVQMMLSYKDESPEKSAVIQSFKSTGSHVIRYSSHEWSGIWSDVCIEQTLMRSSKSDGGLSGGRFRNSESAHRRWVQTLSHMPLINRLSQKSAEVESQAVHRELGAARDLLMKKQSSLLVIGYKKCILLMSLIVKILSFRFQQD